MTIDRERFLAPIDGEDPVGPDLAYDADRFRIEQAFEVAIGPDGTTDIDAPSPDWRETIAAIVAQADRSKDIWLAVYLARAGALAGRLDTVVDGVNALAGLLDRYWDQVHPRLEDYGFLGRKSACDTLATFREFVGPLQRVPLLEHPRLGVFNGADIVRFARGGANEEGYGAFRAMLDEPEAGVAALVALAARLDELLAVFGDIDTTLATHADEATGTNFAPVYDALRPIRSAVNALLPDELRSDIGEHAAPVQTGSALPDTLSGRADVTRALDLVIDFYRRHEPSNPIPLLLERAKTWVALDFMDILEDLAPRSVEEVRNIVSSRIQR